MKTETITGIMSDFLDSIRAYEHESGSAITYDERGSSEFVNIFFGDGDFKIVEEKPKNLFVTEDGVEVFDRDEYYSIGVDFKAIRRRALEPCRPYSSDVKRFRHESNADNYIWRNKPVFSYEELTSKGLINEDDEPFVYYNYQKRELEQLAKERAGYEQ